MSLPPFRLLARSPLALLIALRWLSIAGQSVTVAVVEKGFGMRLPLLPLFLMLLAQVFFNLWSMWRLTRTAAGADRTDFLALQFTFDTLALAVMLYFTGGAFNPFVSLFLVPLAISAVMLPVAYTCCLVVLTIFLYGSLMDNSIALPQPYPISLHLMGMWANFIISACLITGFVTFLSFRHKASLQELRLMREQNLRQEQILALATLAAGTAHELGTPLATMAVVMADLEQDVPEPFQEDIRLVQQQISLCKNTLSRLVQDVRQGKHEICDQNLQAFTDQILEHFSLLHPAVKVSISPVKEGATSRIRVDRQLEQALLNLLNNAADVSPHEISLRYGVCADKAWLEIGDRGPGVSAGIQADAGNRIVNAGNEAGMGIGLLLSNATVERHAGEVRMTPRHNGGTKVTVTLPLIEEPGS